MPAPTKPLTSADLSALEHAFAADPASDAYRPLTEAYLALGRFMEAMVVCKKGVKAHPDDPAAKVLLARVYADQGKDRKALEELQAVVAAYPTFAAANRLAGVLHFRLGEREQGEAALRRAAEAAPNDPDVREAIAKHGVSVLRPQRPARRRAAPRRAARLARRTCARPSPSAPRAAPRSPRRRRTQASPATSSRTRTCRRRRRRRRAARGVELAKALADKYATREFMLRAAAEGRPDVEPGHDRDHGRPRRRARGVARRLGDLPAVRTRRRSRRSTRSSRRSASSSRRTRRRRTRRRPRRQGDPRPGLVVARRPLVPRLRRRDPRRRARRGRRGEGGGGAARRRGAEARPAPLAPRGGRGVPQALRRRPGGREGGRSRRCSRARRARRAPSCRGPRRGEPPRRRPRRRARHAREGAEARDPATCAWRGSSPSSSGAAARATSCRPPGFYDYALRIQKEHVGSILGKALILLDARADEEAGRAADLALSPQAAPRSRSRRSPTPSTAGCSPRRASRRTPPPRRTEASKLDPTSADIPSLVGARKLREGDATGAVEAYQRAVALDGTGACRSTPT